MLIFLENQILFYISLILVLFLPGYFLLLAVFGKSKIISSLEKFIISFSLSIVSIDFIFFFYDKIKIPITRLSSFVGIASFIVICYAIYKFKNENSVTPDEETEKLFTFSRNQFILIFLLIFLAFFIKTAYLSGTIFPSATDMGHHMYWAKWLADNGKLPVYEGMPDFIIGEHIIFGIINILSGASFFSAFPPVVLYLINILSILAIFILVVRVFKNKNIAILSLLFVGVLYAVSSPQAKFVSGGVVGNIMGNFFLPLMFYFYYRAFEFFDNIQISRENSKKFLALAVFLTTGLFYTHHLTVFIFLFIFLLLIVIFLAVNYKEIKNILMNMLKIVFSPQVIGILILCLFFFFFVFTPNYIKTGAVDTAVGAPSKETRVGLSFDNLRGTVGEARIALGIFGLVVLAAGYKKKNFGYAIIASWSLMIWIMSSMPHLLFINLPSSRIGNYLSYPLAILAAFGFYFVFKNHSYNFLIKGSFVVIFTFALVSGISDSTVAFKSQNNSSDLVQTFNSSQYIAENTTMQNVILKDHNYITGDSWMKLFFMRGYKYPQSRGYFKRYEDQTKPRENCTLVMISNPNGDEAKECFFGTGTDYIIVNPLYDSAQFKKLSNFNEIYNSGDIVVFYRNK